MGRRIFGQEAAASINVGARKLLMLKEIKIQDHLDNRFLLVVLFISYTRAEVAGWTLKTSYPFSTMTRNEVLMGILWRLLTAGDVC